MSEEHAEYTIHNIKDDEWVSHAEAGRIEDAIVAYIRARGWVTFVELVGAFAPYVVALENSHTILGFDTNIVLWGFRSGQLADAANRLLDEKKIFLHPAKGRYKSPHWLPACLRLAPYTGKAKRAVRKK